MSIWLDEVAVPKYPLLTQNLEVEVAIVGGGIHGVLATYLLSQAGVKVCLVEQNTIGSGDTGHTTAFISHYIDADISELVETFGKKSAQRVWQSCQAAIDKLETIVRTEKIACDFERVDLVVGASNHEGWQELQTESELAQELGFELKLDAQSKAPMADHGALIVPNQAKFHPLKFLTALLKKSAAQGALIFENTRVEEIELETPALLQTIKGMITAQNVIAATGSPINSQLMIQSKIQPFNSFVIAGALAANIPEGLYIDTQSPYHYLRVNHGQNQATFLFGGEDKASGDPTPADESFAQLSQFLKEHIDSHATITHQWGGQILNSIDGLPYIGRHPFHRNQYLGTGFGGDGMPFGTLAAMINTDLILKRESEFAHLYAPGRIKNVGQYLKQTLKYPEEMLKKFTQHQEGNVDELKAGEGMVIEKAGEKVAVLKNDQGENIELSAVCTHMGCIVGWNSALKSWDCPCHGSRFAATGEVLRGPATKPLAKL